MSNLKTDNAKQQVAEQGANSHCSEAQYRHLADRLRELEEERDQLRKRLADAEKERDEYRKALYDWAASLFTVEEIERQLSEPEGTPITQLIDELEAEANRVGEHG